MSALATTATFLCSVLSGLSGDKIVRVAWSLVAPVMTTVSVAVPGGGNLTASPAAGTTLVVIVPPSSNSQALTLKGNSADVGYGLHPTAPTVLSYSGSGAFIISAAAGSSVPLEISYI